MPRRSVGKAVKSCLQEGLQTRLRLAKPPRIPRRARRAATGSVRRAKKAGKPIARVLGFWVARLYKALKRRVLARKRFIKKLQRLEAAGKLNAAAILEALKKLAARVLRRHGKPAAAVPEAPLREAADQIMQAVAEKKPVADASDPILDALFAKLGKEAAQQQAASQKLETAVAKGAGLGQALNTAASSPGCKVKVSRKMRRQAKRAFKRCMRRTKNFRRCQFRSTRRMRKHVRKVCRRNRKRARRLQKASKRKGALRRLARKIFNRMMKGARASARAFEWFLRQIKRALSRGEPLVAVLNRLRQQLRKKFGGRRRGGMGMGMGGMGRR